MAPHTPRSERLIPPRRGSPETMALIDQDHALHRGREPAAAEQLVRVQQNLAAALSRSIAPLRPQCSRCEHVDWPARVEGPGDGQSNESLSGTHPIREHRAAMSPDRGQGAGERQVLIGPQPGRRRIVGLGRQECSCQRRRDPLRRGYRPRPQPLGERVRHAGKRLSDQARRVREPVGPASLARRR
jgi:hypothetical protein